MWGCLFILFCLLWNRNMWFFLMCLIKFFPLSFTLISIKSFQRTSFLWILNTDELPSIKPSPLLFSLLSLLWLKFYESVELISTHWIVCSYSFTKRKKKIHRALELPSKNRAFKKINSGLLWFSQSQNTDQVTY